MKLRFSLNNVLIHFLVKNVFFMSIFGGWSIEYENNLCTLCYLHVKLQPQETKSVEMRAKNVRQVNKRLFNVFFFMGVTYFSQQINKGCLEEMILC